jgi:Chaperone of endosialidase
LAGNGHTGSDSYDIDIGERESGVAGESSTIRIGDSDQSTTYIAGIHGESIPGPDASVLINADGELGTATSSLSTEKMDISPLSPLAPLVLKLRPVDYRYKSRYASSVNPTQYGLIAQQVQKVLPALVQYGANGKPTGVYYQELPALLLAVIERQQREIDWLMRHAR